MATLYVENPHNFNEIEHDVIQDKEQILQEMLMAGKCYFYDACSFRKHVNMAHPEHLFDFIKANNGVIIITRCIIMELASHSGVLNTEYIDYIKSMGAAGVKVLVIYEEDVYEVLSQCYSSNVKINDCLSWAVKAVKRHTSTIEATLQADKSLLRDIMNGNVMEGNLYKRFFQSVRSNKESEDNLGEELIAICVHLLANIPDIQSYKYIVLTDDKGAIGLINKASKNVYEHMEKYAFSALTTARLAQRLYEESIISGKNQVEEILALGLADDTIKVIGSEEYDLDMKEKVMTCSELADKIMTPNGIHINF